MIYPTKNYYEGNWDHDKKHGFGTIYWINANEKVLSQYFLYTIEQILKKFLTVLWQLGG